MKHKILLRLMIGVVIFAAIFAIGCVITYDALLIQLDAINYGIAISVFDLLRFYIGLFLILTSVPISGMIIFSMGK